MPLEEEFPRLKEWVTHLWKRESFVKGFNVPPPLQDEKALSHEERAEQAKKWIQRGMKDDAAKKGA